MVGGGCWETPLPLTETGARLKEQTVNSRRFHPLPPFPGTETVPSVDEHRGGHGGEHTVGMGWLQGWVHSGHRGGCRGGHTVGAGWVQGWAWVQSGATHPGAAGCWVGSRSEHRVLVSDGRTPTPTPVTTETWRLQYVQVKYKTSHEDHGNHRRWCSLTPDSGCRQRRTREQGKEAGPRLNTPGLKAS